MSNKKYIMKKVLILLVTISFTSCGPLQNICKKSERVSGEVIYALPSKNHARLVYLEVDGKIIKIYGVPIEQPLYNIPVCKYHGRYYWVMP